MRLFAVDARLTASLCTIVYNHAHSSDIVRKCPLYQRPLKLLSTILRSTLSWAVLRKGGRLMT